MLSDDGLDLLFRDARTHKVWLDRPVPDELLRRVYDLARIGPTAPTAPAARAVPDVAARPRSGCGPRSSPGNVDKTMQAPVTAIIGHAVDFYDELPRLFPRRATCVRALRGEARVRGRDRVPQSAASRAPI